MRLLQCLPRPVHRPEGTREPDSMPQVAAYKSIRRVVKRPEIEKTSLIDLSLPCSRSKLYSFAGNGVVPRVSSFRIRAENAVRHA